MKPKIFFIIPSLRAGGAERVMSFIAQNIDKNKFKPTLVVVGFNNNASYLVDKVDIIFLEKNKVRDSLLELIKLFKKEKPKVVFSSLAHVNTLMAVISVLFPKIKFVGRETFVRTGWKEKKGKSFWFADFMQKKFLDMIVCQSSDMKNDLIKNLNFPTKKLKIINNPVTSQFKLKKEDSDKTAIKLVTVGRLVEQKGHLRLLEVLEKIKTPFEFTIIGDGPLKEELNKKVIESGLTEKVKFVSFTSEPQKYLAESDIYIHGSYLEGFPNVLIESCAVGTPVIAFNAPGGINEIIQKGINGYIANTKDDFFKFLKETLAKNNFEKNKVRDSVVSRYGEEKILKQYEELFSELIAK
ncbi:glycosyltransferase [Cellulophaga baltica]|uniref:glycosyltransferase n=1 Tax=Cellulophaga TaxID=104264 RepID=UPI001C0756A8|nr:MULTISPECIES: glycosyltransferase [Cellulophaga]MBU2996739.1 glycosyltransferase [Cellulophaga baltica]MDO6768135.1 glycosyltransferase [Cellulophaga sp. 1_MG-2023]